MKNCNLDYFGNGKVKNIFMFKKQKVFFLKFCFLYWVLMEGKKKKNSHTKAASQR